MANDRTDLKVDLLGSEVELTGKVMPNGQTRRRVRMGDVAITITTTTVAGWEDSHFHKGLRESYTVIEGCMAFAYESTEEDDQRGLIILGPGDSVSSDINNPHNVYLYAGTTIGVFVYGEPLGNPDSKGNDWWPAEDGFDAWSKGLDEAEIKRLSDF